MSPSSTVRWLSLSAVLTALSPGLLAQTSPLTGASSRLGVYFGTFDNGQGRWAMAVSWADGGHLDFLGRFPGEGVVVASSPYTGDFYAGGDAIAPFVGGLMGDGNVIGEGWLPYGAAWVSGPAHLFNGRLDGPEGPAAAYAGYWRWSDGQRDFLETTLSAVVGPSGTTLVILKGPYVSDEDGMTTTGADGNFALTLSGGTRVAARIDRATARLEATVLREGAMALSAGRAVNLSTLSTIDRSAFASRGFTIAGGTGKRLLFRAVGPSLAPLLGNGNQLADPVIKVWHGLDKVATNDDWDGSDSELRDATARVGALPLSPGSKEAAFIVTLAPGGYVMTVESANPAGSGTVLGEIFDLEPDNGSLQALSVSAQLAPGGAGLTSGFVLAGDQPRSVLIRAVGPKLSGPGYTFGILDPQLEVRTSSGALVALNDNWSLADVRLQAATRAAGLFPLDPGSKDAALLTTLAPGAYILNVRGADTAGGAVLLEIYDWEREPGF